MSYLSDDGDDKTSSHADSLHQQACCAVRLRGWGRRGTGAPATIFTVALRCSRDEQMRMARPEQD
jgi:hypothetical protein